MVDYKDRLESAMAEAEVDTTELARSLKISYQAVRKVLLGGQFGTENNVAAARRLRVNSDWLATGKGERYVTVVAEGETDAQFFRGAPLSDPDRQLLDDFHSLLDEDEKARIRGELAEKATKDRATRRRIEGDALARHGIELPLEEGEEATPEDEAVTARLRDNASKGRPPSKGRLAG